MKCVREIPNVFRNNNEAIMKLLKATLLVLFVVFSICLIVLSAAFRGGQPSWWWSAHHPDCLIQYQNITQPPTEISHVLFGISGSVHTWVERRRYSELWWQPNVTHGFVWMDEQPDPKQFSSHSNSLLPYKVSEDVSKLKINVGSSPAVRIARIVVESFKLGLPDVRWFVMGDDDTVFFPDNLVSVLSKYDHREMYYVGGCSESVEQDVRHSYDMAFGGGGFAVSYPLAAELARIFNGCLERYRSFYGSDERMRACVSELGVSLTKEPGFHQTLEEGEVDGAVGDRERRELDGVDDDLGAFWFQEEEVDGGGGEEEEDGCDHA
ncbi:hypothetical protein SSX86_005032 [Deinandra increscens subsp. villosa]|uniref:Uncharacterized protein n=1 Tax=Deinandra increscens subsp. villosa TaxID=3103831 RepID=A0AAP0DP89_9ASTR